MTTEKPLFPCLSLLPSAVQVIRGTTIVTGLYFNIHEQAAPRGSIYHRTICAVYVRTRPS